MDRKITKYLPPTDQPLARRKSGTVILDEIQTASGLFKKTFEPDNIKLSEAKRLGLEVRSVDIIEPSASPEARQQTTAKLTTEAGQTIWLKRDHRGHWKINLLETVNLENTFRWLDSNQKALEQTLQDRRTETIKRREKIISELFQNR